MDNEDEQPNAIEEEIQQVDNEKLKKIENEKQELLNSVISGNIYSTRERVGFVLNHYPITRNSDIELAWNFWRIFEFDVFDGQSITKRQLYELTKMTTLSRERAKIQNEYNLFQADDVVKKHRGTLEIEKKNAAIADKPTDLPVYSVFIDEAGKTQDYLSVGSLWIIDGGFSTIKTRQTIDEWRKHNNIDFEFHFADVSKNRVQIYKDFFSVFLSLNPTIGFKAIIINNKGFKGSAQVITDLTYHLIKKGIEHENESRRAPLPRVLQVWPDADEKGSDKLKLENIKERLNSQKIEGLHLGTFEPVGSQSNHFIQVADLFTSSVNRRVNNPNSEGHFKDELADYILTLLKFEISEVDKLNQDTDKSAVFNLTYTD